LKAPRISFSIQVAQPKLNGFSTLSFLPYHPPPANQARKKKEMAIEKEKQDSYYNHQRLVVVPHQHWFTKLVSFQSDIIYNCIVSLLAPFLTLSSMASESYRMTEMARVPHKASFTMMVRKIGLGVVGVLHVSLVMLMLMALAVGLGVGFIRMLAEEPVFLRHKLLFDYTLPNPVAVLHKPMAIPVGHTFHVSLALLMPESDYNRHIGLFQLSAEVLSASGDVTARTSRPCMLKFRSFPVRMARTFFMGIPLLLGISDETQKIFFQLLKHKEVSYQRTGAIRVTLSPRAGTSYLPQLYEAEMVINSQLPWSKELLQRWKWTFYVWTSIYIYIGLVIILISCFRILLFPIPTLILHRHGPQISGGGDAQEEQRSGDERETTLEMVRKWQMHRRRKRKASSYLYGDGGEETGAVSSITISSRDDAASSTVADEEIGDSESVCFGG
ncbi:SEI1, partial [Linum grandiflorum]